MKTVVSTLLIATLAAADTVSDLKDFASNPLMPKPGTVMLCLALGALVAAARLRRG